MGINRFLQFFLPRESKFLVLLKGQVEDIHNASELLVEFMRSQDAAKREAIYADIKKVEQHCDSLTNRILDELNNTFITPFDREDIHTLASQLDDVVDLITGSAKRAVLYQPRSIPQSLADLSMYISRSADSLRIAVDELEKVKRDNSVVRAQCRTLHEIENQADEVYEDFIISLFSGKVDATELIKLMEIGQILENATDKAYHVTDVLKTIIVKYS